MTDSQRALHRIDRQHLVWSLAIAAAFGVGLFAVLSYVKGWSFVPAAGGLFLIFDRALTSVRDRAVRQLDALTPGEDATP